MKSITTTLGFFLATISLALSSMQISLAATSRSSGPADAFWVFAMMVVFATGIAWALLIAIPLAFLVWQLWFGFRRRGGVNV